MITQIPKSHVYYAVFGYGFYKIEDLTEEQLENVDWECIEDKIIDQRRWATVHEVIFKYNGKFYQTTYEVGSTEMQDTRPFENDPDMIDCQEVKQVEKMVKIWVIV